jgi:GNAT superfamily N-acetyltransferase
MRPIVRAGETFSWDRGMGEEQARVNWMNRSPGRTLVAVDESGTIRGSAEMGPNHGGGGAHVASAGFMVDPDHSGKGFGRALGEQVIETARADGYLAIQFNAVVESNSRAVALWRSLGFEVIATVPEGFRRPDGGLVGLHIMYLRL